MATGHLNNVEGFIKAITSYGGEDYPQFEEWYTTQNAISFQVWLNCQPKADGVTLYRGYTFGRSYFEDADMRLGKVIGVDQLTQETLPSFTPDLIRASMYVNEYGEIGSDDGVRVLFVVRTKGKYFVDISELAYYKEERQYNCVNDARLKIVAFQRNGSCLQIELKEV